MTAKIMIVVEDPKWTKLGAGLARRLRKAARSALGDAEGAVTILLADDTRLRALNAQFRGKDKPTNVLAFPASESGYLGDIAIAYGTAAKEARAAKKPLIDHVTHLTLHGTLHLLGYDHLRAREARTMEALETELLARLGVADPYLKATR
jgi:probable rRNA maturation factor